MKKIFYTTVVFLITLIGSVFIFLNKDKTVQLILSPEINGYYYHTPNYPIGIIVVFSIIVGFLIGFIACIITRPFKG